MSNLIDRLVNESNGKNLVAEIYSSSNGGYEINYFINGVPSGQVHRNASLEYVKNEASEWMTGVKVIYG